MYREIFQCVLRRSSSVVVEVIEYVVLFKGTSVSHRELSHKTTTKETQTTSSTLLTNLQTNESNKKMQHEGLHNFDIERQTLATYLNFNFDIF